MVLADLHGSVVTPFYGTFDSAGPPILEPDTNVPSRAITGLPRRTRLSCSRARFSSVHGISCRNALSLPNSADFLIDVPDDAGGRSRVEGPEPDTATTQGQCAALSQRWVLGIREGHILSAESTDPPGMAGQQGPPRARSGPLAPVVERGGVHGPRERPSPGVERPAVAACGVSGRRARAPNLTGALCPIITSRRLLDISSLTGANRVLQGTANLTGRPRQRLACRGHRKVPGIAFPAPELAQIPVPRCCGWHTGP